jgi:hypothetical protein
MKRPSSARAVAKAKGKTTTKGIGKDKGKGKGKGKGKKGNGKGKGKPGHGPLATCHPPWALSCAICHMQPRQAMAVAIDDDDAARAAIRAEADAIPESTVEAIMVEARTRDVLMFILDMHRQRVNNRARFCARRLSMELDSLDRNAH